MINESGGGCYKQFPSTVAELYTSLTNMDVADLASSKKEC